MTAATTRWWWIRHAPVTCHGGRIYGQDDHPADCTDPALFRGLAAALPPDAVWVASHLRRTHQTAEAIARAIRAANGAGGEPDSSPEPLPRPLIEPGLAEQHFGEWEGLTIDELKSRRNADAWHRFWLAPAHEAPPGGESFEQVVERVAAAVERLTTAYRGRDIVAVAHGGSIRAALAIALGLEPERALSFVIDNCSLTRLDHIDEPGTVTGGGAWRVTTVNLHPKAPFGL